MKTWAIANQKGGVGKTTTSLCLARLLVESGKEVIVLDLDPHASLTRAFGIPASPVPAGVHELFADNPPPLASLLRQSSLPGLRLLPAQSALATLERGSSHRPGLGRVLQTTLEKSSALADFALIDCPPMLGLLMVSALAAADRLIVPTQTDPLAMHGLHDMLRTADMVERSRARPLPRHILPTLFDGRTRSGRDSLQKLQDHGAMTCPQPIPMDTRLRDANLLAADTLPASRGLDAYRLALQWLHASQAPHAHDATAEAA